MKNLVAPSSLASPDTQITAFQNSIAHNLISNIILIAGKARIFVAKACGLSLPQEETAYLGLSYAWSLECCQNNSEFVNSPHTRFGARSGGCF